MEKINAPAAWNITTGGSVKVAVIDSGVDYNHPDLAANVWTNPGEIAGNGVDDDHNGFIDDTRGWDFVNNDNNPMDDNGHGTHVAGTIAARGNNGIGVAGVAWTAQIIPLKTQNTQGNGFTSDAVKAINYAAHVGAKVINASFGGSAADPAEDSAIAAANLLVVAAAGNNGSNNDVTPFYPASFNRSNIISVANTTQSDTLNYDSNYGTVSVDLAAPGYAILSTVPGGG